MAFKVIIAGGRDYDDYETLSRICFGVLEAKEEVEIVSGGCSGADKLGERWGYENDHAIKVFPADWERHGKKAGPIRNWDMAQYADGLIAFWDGKSKGTKSMIAVAEKFELKVRVYKY